MTEAEKDLFLNVMSSGCFMGMGHPFECLLNYERMLDAVAGSETELNELTKTVNQAFLAFWKTTDPELDKMTPGEFNAVVDAWFENREKQKQRWLEQEIGRRSEESNPLNTPKEL